MAFRTNKTPVLQEKSASGSVATFNTALAMPLVECKTEFMCTQEAGTPSPSNPLAITGVDKVAIQQTGGNIWDEETELGRWNGSTWVYADNQLKTKNYIPVLPNHLYRLVNPSGTASRYVFYDKDKQYISDTTANSNTTFRTPNNAYYMMYGMASYYGTTYKYNVSINISSSDTTYHAYKANTVTLIDLDGTRYGGYVDVVRKKAYISLGFKKIKDIITDYSSSTQRFYGTVNDMKMTAGIGIEIRLYCEIYKPDTSRNLAGGLGNYKICPRANFNPPQLLLRDDDYSSLDTFIANRGDYFVAYELETPIEISLSDIPTLSTIIGNNSFASDSGSIELKYKDLDIAKRGSFREVFRLPS